MVVRTSERARTAANSPRKLNMKDMRKASSGFLALAARTMVAAGALSFTSLSATTASAQQIPAPAEVQPGWLGVVLGTEDASAGVVISRAIPNSPAQRGGVLRGDRILRVNDSAVSTTAELIEVVGSIAAGSEVQLEIETTDDEVVTRTVLLGLRPDDLGSLAAQMVGNSAPGNVIVRDADSGSSGEFTPADGRVRVIGFWATWCGACARAMPDVLDTASTLPAERFEYVAVSGEGYDVVRRYATRLGATPQNVRIVQSENDAASDEYWVTSLPSFFLVDADNEIVAYGHGARGWRALFEQARELVNASE